MRENQENQGPWGQSVLGSTNQQKTEAWQAGPHQGKAAGQAQQHWQQQQHGQRQQHGQGQGPGGVLWDRSNTHAQRQVAALGPPQCSSTVTALATTLHPSSAAVLQAPHSTAWGGTAHTAATTATSGHAPGVGALNSGTATHTMPSSATATHTAGPRGFVPTHCAATPASGAGSALATGTVSHGVPVSAHQNMEDFLDGLDDDDLDALLSCRAATTAVPQQQQQPAAVQPQQLQPAGLQQKHQQAAHMQHTATPDAQPLHMADAVTATARSAPGPAGSAAAHMEVDAQVQRLPCRREEEHYIVLEALDEAPNQLTLKLLNEYKVRSLWQCDQAM